ncbi:MAG: T9SS type A sorting domain-containing protein [Ignavibacteria bacterium]|nr:T9SS type A sorting domain-containing protein [Ignavibacteria bacterium]
MLDCTFGCEVYFVPVNSGNFKLVYACYPNCTCDNDNDLRSENGITNNLPHEYALHQNYPNPFNPTTSIKFDLPSDDFVNLSVFDLSGRLVNTIVTGNLTAGSYDFDFIATDYPSGIYIYKLSTRYFEQSRKMVLIK